MESERACLEQDTGNRQQEKSSKQQETRATKQVHMSSLSAAHVTLNCCSGMHGYSKVVTFAQIFLKCCYDLLI